MRSTPSIARMEDETNSLLPPTKARDVDEKCSRWDRVIKKHLLMASVNCLTWLTT